MRVKPTRQRGNPPSSFGLLTRYRTCRRLTARSTRSGQLLPAHFSCFINISLISSRPVPSASDPALATSANHSTRSDRTKTQAHPFPCWLHLRRYQLLSGPSRPPLDAFLSSVACTARDLTSEAGEDGGPRPPHVLWQAASAASAAGRVSAVETAPAARRAGAARPARRRRRGQAAARARRAQRRQLGQRAARLGARRAERRPGRHPQPGRQGEFWLLARFIFLRAGGQVAHGERVCGARPRRTVAPSSLSRASLLGVARSAPACQHGREFRRRRDYQRWARRSVRAPNYAALAALTLCLALWEGRAAAAAPTFPSGGSAGGTGPDFSAPCVCWGGGVGARPAPRAQPPPLTRMSRASETC